MSYHKVNMKLGPTLATAKLVKKTLCLCGFQIINEGVPIGQEYQVDLKSVRWAKWQCGQCGKEFDCRLIDAWGKGMIPWFKPYYMPLEIFDLDARIPRTAKPDSSAYRSAKNISPPSFVKFGEKGKPS